MSKYTKQQLIQILIDYYNTTGIVPSGSYKKQTAAGLPNPKIYEYHFKTWNDALILAGLPLHTSPERRTTFKLNCYLCNAPIEVKNKKFNTSTFKRFYCGHSCATRYNNRNKKYGYRRSKLEIFIEEKLTQLYPNILIEYNEKSAISSELDIYIPSLRMAFEINGILHYEPIYGQEKLLNIQKNDVFKAEQCLLNNIHLYTINTQKSSFSVKNANFFLNIIVNHINQRMATVVGFEPTDP